MSNISAVGGASSAWADLRSARAGAMQDKLFSKVDSDGSGAVDQSELQTMLDKIASRSGQTVGSASDLFGKMDSDGDGSLSKDELGTGMQSLLPPRSTVDFAQRQAGGNSAAVDGLFATLDADGSGGLNGSELNTLLDQVAPNGATIDASTTAKADAAALKALDQDGDGVISKAELGAALQGAGHHGGMHRPPPPDGAEAAAGAIASGSSSAASTGSTSTSSATDPLDTNGDGVVSAQERMAGQLQELMKQLHAFAGSADAGNATPTSPFDAVLGALQSGVGSAGSNASGGSDAQSGGSAQRGLDLSPLARLMQRAYSEAAAAQTTQAATGTATGALVSVAA